MSFTQEIHGLPIFNTLSEYNVSTIPETPIPKGSTSDICLIGFGHEVSLSQTSPNYNKSPSPTLSGSTSPNYAPTSPNFYAETSPTPSGLTSPNYAPISPNFYAQTSPSLYNSTSPLPEDSERESIMETRGKQSLGQSIMQTTEEQYLEGSVIISSEYEFLEARVRRMARETKKMSSRIEILVKMLGRQEQLFFTILEENSEMKKGIKNLQEMFAEKYATRQEEPKNTEKRGRGRPRKVEKRGRPKKI